jgi:uncharacterized membrane protein
MEIVILIVLVILFILILSYKSEMHSRLDVMMSEMHDLHRLIRELKASEKKPEPDSETLKKPKEEFAAEPLPSQIENIEIKTEPEIPGEPLLMPEPEAKVPDTKIPAKTCQASSFFKDTSERIREKRDIEKAIGENLISKIGIIILVLGVGYFVKFAIDQNWINEYGRVVIGLLTGGILIGIAHYLRKSYKTFSSILTGGGLAVFYITVAIAFHQYHIFSQTIAFIITIAITALSVALALYYDKKELAIFALLGGFASPFIVSSGDSNYKILFTYILILNSGILAIGYYKRWHILNFLAYLFTLVLFTGWMFTGFNNSDPPPRTGALIFASLFYGIFFLVNILNILKEKKLLNALEIGMILSNNLFYFLVGLCILYNYHDGSFRGLFTFLMGFYNFVWIILLFRKKQIDHHLLLLLIGLTMSFVSIAIPIQLKGHSITLFWTAEMVLLIWLGQKTGFSVLKKGHLIILGLALLSLVINWNHYYFRTDASAPILANPTFITGFVAIIGIAISLFWVRKEIPFDFLPHFSAQNYYAILVGILFLAVYCVSFFELQFQASHYFESFAFRQTLYAIYHSWYVFTLLIICTRKKWDRAITGFCFTGLGFLFLYCIYYQSQITSIRNQYFEGGIISLSMLLFHYLVIPALGGIVFVLFRNRNSILKNNPMFPKFTLWYLVAFSLFVLSSELDNIVLLIENQDSTINSNILRQTHEVGYPILWASVAFILMLGGMQKRVKDYRILSLSIIGLIILKLFIFDVWKMSEGGRIEAFIFLGVLLLVVSFLYQKLKNIFIETEKEDAK